VRIQRFPRQEVPRPPEHPKGTAVLAMLMRLLAGLAIMLFAACWPWGRVCASGAESPESIRTGYHHMAWTSKDGAPDDIESIAQTPDGWLWFGASSGLYRFDGVTFENIDLRPPDSTDTRDVDAVMTTVDGDVWVSYPDGAVIVARQGDPKKIMNLPGLTPRTEAFFLQQDDWGDVWATTNAGLFVHRDGKWIKPDKYPGFPSDVLTDSLVDGGGNFWVASDSGISVMRKGSHRFESVASGVSDGESVDLFVGGDGRAWALSKNAIFPLSREIPILPLRHTPKESKHVMRTQDGSLWTTTCEPGLCRERDARVTTSQHPLEKFASDRFTHADGMSSDLPIVIFEDREGTVWVLTTGGLDSFRRNNFTEVQFPFPALSFKLAPSNDGSLWVATDAGLPSGDEYLWHLAPTPVKIDGYRGATPSFLREENGDLLLDTHIGMLRYTQGKFVSAGLPSSPPPENRRSLGLIRDKDGKLWSSFVSLSLYRLDGNAWVLNGGLSALPATEPDAMLLASDGKLWLGYGADDVRIVSHGRVESYGAKDGLHIGTVTAILPGTWPLLGGELGVSMFTHGAWHSLRASEPQALKGVWGMARSSDGAIWLNSFAGAVRIDASDLDRAALDPSFVISVRVLGDDDGLPGRGQPISPSMAQTTDGKLWYAQDGGLAWIDPLELRRNMYVPRIVIRSVSTPTGSITLSGPVTLPARTTNVRIAYTALSMANPAKNRFKVRLDG
jgi:ligand-binding sensor domain-containing protein